MLRLVIALGIALLLPSCSAAERGPTNGDRPSEQAALPVQKGHLLRWPEATAHLRIQVSPAPASVELVAQRPPGLSAFWSIASTKGAGSGFFYSAQSPDGDSSIAHAGSARRVQEISDASLLDYSQPSVGPIPAGGIVVVHHAASSRYMALVLDAIEPVDLRTTKTAPYAYADVTWYLAEAGSANFSAAQ